MKKKIFLPLVIVFTHLVSFADEGMWLPIFLKQLNESDMQAKGLKLSADDIYSVNKSSLKDAVVQFNGGCTGEIISSQGLMLTNHHCGYSQIQSHSSVKNDYLTNGFWAMKKEDELPNASLVATFIIRMEDVTAKVLQGTVSGLSEAKRDSIIAKNISEIEKSSVQGTHYEAKIRPFYYGNEYYMFITETYKDVRLVFAPPSSIGKYGGDTDNWMWPRHTGDFAVFRIYANKDNKPAEYSKENVPFKPRHHFPISLKGVEEGDFTMVLGFPGRTTEYLTSYAVDMTMNVSNPTKIKLREKRLAIMLADMKESDETRIKYAAKYAQVSNYHKKWIGENRGLKKLDAINKKRSFEKTFAERVNANSEFEPKYGKLLNQFEAVYKKMDQSIRSYDYFTEAALAVEVIKYTNSFVPLVELSKKPNTTEEEINKLAEKLRSSSTGFFKDYNAATDKKLFVFMLKMYYDNINKNLHPEIFKLVDSKYDGDFSKYAEELYSKSFFTTPEKTDLLLSSYKQKHFKKIEKDPAYILMNSVYDNFRKNILPEYNRLNDEVNRLTRTYMAGLREVITEKKYYPDANSTLRVAYGKAEGYVPQDAVKYNYYTTMDGLMEKADSSSYEFKVSSKLEELYRNKDYGPYAHKNGEMRVCFTASNHTTGGNSGSPVVDAQGNLIGTNFDRTWESTMSDIMFDPDRCRNVVLDVRYTLFVIDKFAGAKHLIDEMTILK